MLIYIYIYIHIHITVVITIVIIYDNYIDILIIYNIFTPPRGRCCCCSLSTNVCCMHVINYVLITMYNFIFSSYMYRYSTKTECLKFNYNTTVKKPLS